MELLELISKSETKQFKVVFPNTLNAHDTLFGGDAMKWMDEVAYIAATRFTRQKMVTVYTGKINFIKPIPFGTIAVIIGKILKVGSVKLDIHVEIYVEEMFTETKFKAVEAIFTFAAVDSNHKPLKICIYDI